MPLAASVGGRLRHESLPNSLPEAPNDLGLHMPELENEEDEEIPSVIPKSSGGDWRTRLKVEEIDDETDESPTEEPPPPVPHYMQSPLSDSRSHTPSTSELIIWRKIWHKNNKYKSLLIRSFFRRQYETIGIFIEIGFI